MSRLAWLFERAGLLVASGCEQKPIEPALGKITSEEEGGQDGGPETKRGEKKGSERLN